MIYSDIPQISLSCHRIVHSFAYYTSMSSSQRVGVARHLTVSLVQNVQAALGNEDPAAAVASCWLQFPFPTYPGQSCTYVVPTCIPRGRALPHHSFNKPIRKMHGMLVKCRPTAPHHRPATYLLGMQCLRYRVSNPRVVHIQALYIRSLYSQAAHSRKASTTYQTFANNREEPLTRRPMIAAVQKRYSPQLRIIYCCRYARPSKTKMISWALPACPRTLPPLLDRRVCRKGGAKEPFVVRKETNTRSSYFRSRIF